MSASSHSPTAPGQRAEELLVKRAVEGLDDAEADELRALGADGDDSYDLAAAAVSLATLVEEPMPADLAARVERDALRQLPTSIATRRERSPGAQRREREVGAAAWLGWLVAASCLLVALIATWRAARPRPPEAPPAPQIVYLPAPAPAPAPAQPLTPSPVEERARLLTEQRDVQRIAWTPTVDPAGRRASGDVVWSRAAQRGFMRFVGLAPNDRRRSQYQLWIFDKRRDARFPVDGGVFDVAAQGEVVVPITARLRVRDATLFAVTVERPGGVVVSNRKRIVVTAAPAHG